MHLLIIMFLEHCSIKMVNHTINDEYKIIDV